MAASLRPAAFIFSSNFSIVALSGCSVCNNEHPMKKSNTCEQLCRKIRCREFYILQSYGVFQRMTSIALEADEVTLTPHVEVTLRSS